MKIYRMLAIPLAGAVLSFGAAAAQDTATQPRETRDQQTQSRQTGASQARPGQTADRAGWQNIEQKLAACAVIANQEEIALSKYAQGKLQNEEVKKFAALMVKEHEAYLTKLEQHAPGAARKKLDTHDSTNRQQARSNASPIQQVGGTQDNPSRVRQASGDQPAPDKNAQAGQNATSQQRAGADLIQIQREIAQECLMNAQKELDSKKGKELDQCFLGQQIAHHAAMKAKLTVFERHASGDLSQLFAEGSETAEKHMNKAIDLMKNLDSKERE